MVHLTGTKGKLSFVPYGRELSVETLQVRRTVRVAAPRRGVRQMVSEFRAAIEEDREPVMSGHEAIRDLAIVLAAYESARTGQVVNLSEPHSWQVQSNSSKDPPIRPRSKTNKRRNILNC